jgi:2-oxoisovalerate dehydrogenase E1 component
MITTRVAHNVSRRAAITGSVYYTIGPGGHEAVAGVAAALRPTDPAILHYRDTAFQVQRASQVGHTDMLQKLMRSYTVSSLDSCTGGRHKALGDKSLNIIPSTSTISSHFPRVAGLAASLPLVKHLRVAAPYPLDSVVVGCGGDASINHATFVTAVNFLKYSHHALRLKIPCLIVISDNGIGISVPTPEGWVQHALSSSGLAYFRADGTNVYDVYAKSIQAANSARNGTPTFLHMECSRLFNHAGSDAGAYQTPEEIVRHIRGDPIPTTMHLWVRDGLATKEELEKMYLDTVKNTEAMLLEVVKEPKLITLEEVMASLVPQIHTPHTIPPGTTTDVRPLIYKQQITRVLDEALTEDPSIVLVGQDIGKKGGNYGVTDNLQKKFGQWRVRDTLLDETTILGIGCGFSLNGLLPVVEICYLAYIHNAIDQLRGEAATMSFFSNKQYKNGFIIRVAGGGLTEFGGHYHNENSLACLLDIPGIVVLYPSNGPDYVRYFRKCRDLCQEGRVVVIVEPIKAYALRHFGEKNTNWAFPYPARHEVLELGSIHTYGEGKDLAIATYGNGVVLSLEAQRILKQDHGIDSTVVEQSTLRGGDPDAFPKVLSTFKKVLFADECRNQGAICHEVVSLLATRFPEPSRVVGTVTAADCLIPLGQAANVRGLYLSEARIVQAALDLKP